MQENPRRKWHRVIVPPDNTPSSRTFEERADSIKEARGGDIQMGSAESLNRTFKNDKPGDMRISAVEFYLAGRDERGRPLWSRVISEEWVETKYCSGCHLQLPNHYILVYSGADVFLDALIKDRTHFKHYHVECEPTDPQYKFQVEYGGIKRTEYGSEPGPITPSKMN